MNIYLASSWRNTRQPDVLEALRNAGHRVYDFRNPAPNRKGFSWSDVDPDWKAWTPEQFRELLNHPISKEGFGFDWRAMNWADAGVLLMPCGRSAHLEAGYFVGAGRPLFILLSDGEPELMYKMATGLACSVDELLEMIKRVDR